MKNEADLDRLQQEQQSLRQHSWKGFTFVNESMNGRPHSDQANQNRVLATTRIGDRLRILSLNCGEANNRLMGMGLIPDAVLEVISRTPTGSVIVALQDQRLGLGAEMAQQIEVVDAEQPVSASPDTSTPDTSTPDTPTPDTSTPSLTTMKTTTEGAMVKLRDAAIGTTLRVIGYEPTARDYKRKLLAMGLTPGTELRVTRHAPLGDPTEIAVRGFQLSLRKAEADALIVAPASGS
jgi:ferrous iron transport protein A